MQWDRTALYGSVCLRPGGMSARVGCHWTEGFLLHPEAPKNWGCLTDLNLSAPKGRWPVISFS